MKMAHSFSGKNELLLIVPSPCNKAISVHHFLLPFNLSSHWY